MLLLFAQLVRLFFVFVTTSAKPLKRSPLYRAKVILVIYSQAHLVSLIVTDGPGESQSDVLWLFTGFRRE
jgi:hypothetical protein